MPRPTSRGFRPPISLRGLPPDAIAQACFFLAHELKPGKNEQFRYAFDNDTMVLGFSTSATITGRDGTAMQETERGVREYVGYITDPSTCPHLRPWMQVCIACHTLQCDLCHRCDTHAAAHRRQLDDLDGAVVLYACWHFAAADTPHLPGEVRRYQYRGATVSISEQRVVTILAPDVAALDDAEQTIRNHLFAMDHPAQCPHLACWNRLCPECRKPQCSLCFTCGIPPVIRTMPIEWR